MCLVVQLPFGLLLLAAGVHHFSLRRYYFEKFKVKQDGGHRRCTFAHSPNCGTPSFVSSTDPIPRAIDRHPQIVLPTGWLKGEHLVEAGNLPKGHHFARDNVWATGGTQQRGPSPFSLPFCSGFAPSPFF